MRGQVCWPVQGIGVQPFQILKVRGLFSQGSFTDF